MPDQEAIDENRERARREALLRELEPHFIDMSMSPPAMPAADNLPLEPTQRQTYGPAMPVVPLAEGQYPQDYLDRMRRGQSTDADNEYSDS
jgi:hypothetical protein